MICPQCDNDQEFEYLQDDEEYTHICGACGWKLEDKESRIRIDLAKWIDPLVIADLIIDHAKEENTQYAEPLELTLGECKTIWLNHLQVMGELL